ncbi:TPA: prophage tail fiber N-terminal domain-containing protein [Citrobacter murliniae]
MTQKTISGIFADPNGVIVSGVTLSFTLLNNTADSFVQRYSECVTSSDGAYSITLGNGIYQVNSQDINLRRINLGTIAIDEDSVDGSLNTFLLASASSQTNAILIAVQAAYAQMLGLLQNPAVTVATYSAIPANPSGWYLVTADETKSSGPSVYLFKDGARYWFAMVEDA